MRPVRRVRRRRRRRHPPPARARVSGMQRRSSLDDALRELEAGTLAGIVRIVVSRSWWDALSPIERDGGQRRAERLGVALTADDRISRHFVELVEASDEEGSPPLSSERRV